MHRTLTARLALVVFALTATHASMASIAESAGCGRSSTADSRQVSLASIRSKVPLYVMEESGRLVKMELGSGERMLLSDHRFYMTPTLRASRDGRWLSYKGVLKGTGKTQYWMYDRHKQDDHLVYEHPAWGGGIPGFSPDSRYLAISASHDSRWTDTAYSGHRDR